MQVGAIHELPLQQTWFKYMKSAVINTQFSITFPARGWKFKKDDN
jgi:hypothetical protein